MKKTTNKSSEMKKTNQIIVSGCQRVGDKKYTACATWTEVQAVVGSMYREGTVEFNLEMVKSDKERTGVAAYQSLESLLLHIRVELQDCLLLAESGSKEYHDLVGMCFQVRAALGTVAKEVRRKKRDARLKRVKPRV